MKWLVAAALLLCAGPADASGGEAVGLWTRFWHAFNLLVILGVIVYYGRKPVMQFLGERRVGIQEDLEKSARLLEQAESRLAEWKERTAQLDSELAGIRETSLRLAQEERDEILAQARATAERIRNDAQAAVHSELRRAKSELSAEAAELAVDLAAKLIAEKVSDDDHQRLLDEFLTRVETLGDSAVDGREGR